MAKFLRAPILKNNFEQLLLSVIPFVKELSFLCKVSILVDLKKPRKFCD